jgi:MFS family permease
MLYSRDFRLVFAASFALNSAANLFVLFPLFLVSLGGGASIIGAVIGTGSFAALMVRPLVGSGIDRFGCKWMALRFLILDAMAVALYPFVRSLGWPIYAVRLLHGAVDGTARVALFTFVYDILPSGREGEGMAIFSLCGMVPAALAPIIGEELIKRYGFAAFFGAVTVLSAAGATTVARMRHDKPRQINSEAHGTPGPAYSAMIANRAMLPLWIVTLGFSLALSSRLSFVAPFAYQEGIERVGWYFAIYSAAAVVLRLFGARAIDRTGFERVLAPSLLVLGCGLALIALIGRPWMLELAALVGGAGHGYVYPALSALVIARTPSDAMGRSSTVYTSLYDLGTMLGPYVLGATAAGLGYAAMFVTAGLLSAAAGAFFVCAEPQALFRK